MVAGPERASRMLVTGAAGFIGSNFVLYLLGTRSQVRIVGLDKLTYAGNLNNLAELTDGQRTRFSFVEGDIADAGLVDEILGGDRFDAVINFAAESHVDRSIRDAMDFVRTNVLGCQVLLAACTRHWRQRGRWLGGCKFIQISTDEVYGALGPEGAFCEATPLAPRNPYAASKAAADHLVLAAHNTHGLPVNIIRSCNAFGPRQFPEKLIPLTIQRSLDHRPVPVYGSGRQVRDWLHVRDHCRAVEAVLGRGRPGRVYNLGAGFERENLTVVQTLLDVLRERTGDAGIDRSLIGHVADRPGHDFRYATDAGRIETELGFEARVPFEDGLRETVDWYLANRPWLDQGGSGAARLEKAFPPLSDPDRVDSPNGKG